MSTRADGMSELSKLVEWIEAISARRPNDEIMLTIRNLDNPGWEVSLDACDAGMVPSLVQRREEASPDGSWLSVAPDGNLVRAACGPTGVGPALVAMLEVVERFEETRRD